MSVTPSSPFIDRHIGPDDQAVAHMLATIGYESLDALSDAVVPGVIRWREALAIPAGRTEPEVTAELREIASRNRVVTSMIGLGHTDTITPGVIKRNVLESPAW